MHEVKLPEVTLEDFLKQATSDILSILNTTPDELHSTVPKLSLGDDTKNALVTIADALHRVEKLPAFKPLLEPSTPPVAVPRVSISHPSNPLPRVSKSTKSVRFNLDANKVYEPPVAPISIPNITPTTPPVTSTSKFPSTPTVPVIPSTPSKATTSPSPPLKHPNVIPFEDSELDMGFNTPYNLRSRATCHLVAQQLFQPVINHIYDEKGKKLGMETLLTDPKYKDIWNKSMSNELGRLAQGNKYGIKSNDAIDFIYKCEVPKEKKVTYANFVCDYRPLKSDPNRVRLVVGVDKLDYAFDSGSPAATLLETKLLVNSVISDSDKGARFCSMDLKDHFLATPMKEYEYMRIPYRLIPQDIREQYQLESKVHDGHIYCRIKRGMYGLKQAAVLAYDHLCAHLSKYGYHHVPGTTGVFDHVSRPTKFCLCVDDFGVKHFSKDDANHLLSALQDLYGVTVDWEGKNFCGLTFNWNYEKRYVDISMPQYVQDALKRLQHQPKVFPQYSPYHFTPVNYSKLGSRQYATQPDTSPLLNKTETTYIQSVIGSFLYYSRAVDPTALVGINTISFSQSQPTLKTKQECQQLMDYFWTYPNAYIRYHASDMLLHVDSDAAYLVLPKAKSRVGGYFQLANKHDYRNTSIPPNGAVHIESKTLRHVVASSAEAEVAGIFHNAQTALSIRTILNALGHPQPPTPIKTDNSTAHGFVHDNINQKRSKSWDMRYYWLRDKIAQALFDIYWRKGSDNHGDYWTKNFATIYHRSIRSQYVRDKEFTESLNAILSLTRSLVPPGVLNRSFNPPPPQSRSSRGSLS